MASTDFTVSAQKYSDGELLAYMGRFLKDNDQLPPYLTIANHFGVAPNGVNERLHRLEKEGHLQRNEVNKIMFSRNKSPNKK